VKPVLLLALAGLLTVTASRTANPIVVFKITLS
jgi:hypothetical protein